MSAQDAGGPIDPEAAVAALIRRLEDARTEAVPRGPLPPADIPALEAARADARAAAEGAGRGKDLDRAQKLMAEWMFQQYQLEGFESGFLLRGNDSLERRKDVIDLMVDAATAAAMADLLPEETHDVLMERFEELHGDESED